MNKQLGFTLMELLIVIAVMGILMAGLLAAVDPFEQLKKGRDTSAKNAVVEFFDAATRYYGSHGAMPWFDPAGCNTGALDKQVITGLSACVTNIEADGELKKGFISNLGADASRIYVTSASGGQMIACFSPTSKSIFKDSTTKFDQSGNDLSATTCSSSAKASLTPGTTCYWCAQ